MEFFKPFLFESPQICKRNRKEAERIMNKYPDRIPIIVTKNNFSKTTPDIDKCKFMVPEDLTVGQFMYVIRKRIQMSPDKALFLFVDGATVCSSELVSTVYYRSHDPEDGFLYCIYSCENTFG